MVLRYVALVSKVVTGHDLEEIVVPALGEAAREVVMTFGQELIEEGRRLGRAEGKAEGEAKGKAEALLAMLRARGIAVPEELRQRIRQCTDIPTLDGWIVRAATAASVHDVVTSD